MKFATTPTGSVAPETKKYRKFLMKIMRIPIADEKTSAANKAGTSLKSTFKYGGNNGKGKLIKNKTTDTADNNATTTIFVNFCDLTSPITISSFKFASTLPIEGFRYDTNKNPLKQSSKGHYKRIWKNNTNKPMSFVSLASSPPIQTILSALELHQISHYKCSRSRA